MKLTYLLASPTFGMHQYTADLANRMAGSFTVDVVTTRRYPADRYGPAVRVHTPADIGNTGLSLESLQVGKLGQLKRSLEELGPDLVHITGPHMWNVSLVRWLRRRGIPVVHTIHDLDPHHGTTYGRLLHFWNWAIIRAADHIVVHGEIYRKRLIESGRQPTSVTSTPLTHLFVGYETGQKLSAGGLNITYEPMVLFFGRQERYKGVDILIRAFESLNGRLGDETDDRPLRLVLAGPGDAYRESYGDRSPGVEWRNWLIGDAEGVELFRRCAVVVLPYRDGTQSALVSAAYYFQKPVIATAVGALSEYVESGKTGIVVEAGDAEALAEAIADVLRTPQRKEGLGQAGKIWYDEHRAKETLRLKRLYRQLIN